MTNDDDDGEDGFEYDDEDDGEDGFKYDDQQNPPSVGNSTVNDSDTKHESNASTKELYQQFNNVLTKSLI